MSLHYKLFAAILAAILFVVLYMTIVFQWSFDRGFLEYVNTVEREQLEKIAEDFTLLYEKRKSWDWIDKSPHEVAVVIVNSYPEGEQKERFINRLREKEFSVKFDKGGPLPKEVPVHFFRRVFLLDASKNILMGYDPESTAVSPFFIEIFYQNSVVGYLGAHPARHLSASHHLVFVEQQKGALILVAIAGILLAAGLSFPFARRLTKPIRKMAEATRNLASGKYSTRLIASRRDELGNLAQSLNDLAVTLEKNRNARRQWIADISHELRTPLAILQGKIEGLLDGVYEPGKPHFQELHSEVLHLGLIVDDLYQLSLSDAGAMSYNKVEVDPCWALQQAIALLKPQISEKRQRLELRVEVEPHVSLFGDNERLKQLFTNLLANSSRYTDADGIIRISVEDGNRDVHYIIEDSAPGVTEENLPNLFNRLYRVEESRNRSSGGTGLGLSICQNIVQGHNGTITAGNSPLGGLRIAIALPQSLQAEL